MTGVINVLQDELNAGFPHLGGTRLSGCVPITERLLNRFTQKAILEILPDNQVVVKYGVVNARATISRVVALDPSPTLEIRLANVFMALALRAFWNLQFSHLTFVSFSGTRMLVDLAAIPQVAQWRHLWRYVDSMDIRSDSGKLDVCFQISIKESN